ncbi:hypothetical protein B0T18DRAFT_398971 [Schizothecium vesticola]|uniref:Uncharacterized protein n=1 Tax=Schizothecium vesticola TaxID=314040 RepID=A0AA40KCW5_9PEZI|nr:hypothetical protein B0T18DRAFT_398971 [Schizothecium vesticola]
MKGSMSGGHHNALAAIGVSFAALNGSLALSNITQEELKLARITSYAILMPTISPYTASGQNSPTILSSQKGGCRHPPGGLVAIWRHAYDPAFMPFIGEGGQLDENESEESAAVATGFHDDEHRNQSQR